MSELEIVFVDLAMVQQALARALGRAPSSVTPDAVAKLLGEVAWKSAEGWETQNDYVVASSVGLFSAGLSGDLLVVTEASFAPARGAFLICSQDLSRFVSEHLARYGECFFNGDVVIVERLGGRFWLFHHEGMYVCGVGAQGE